MMSKLVLVLVACAQTWAAPNYQELTEQEMHPDLPAPHILRRASSDELTADYWLKEAQNTVRDKVTRKINKRTAKNVILFLGDGMSIPTVSAARVYLGGEEAQVSFEKFPYVGLSKTYAVDRQVADSANTATAYLCGVKANYGTMGVGPEVRRSDCAGQANVTNHVYSIAYYSQLKQKQTGLVTTARVTHASPGGVYAHTANRDWESDTNVLNANKDPTVCSDIASQLVYGETGRNLNVVLGGGRAKFLPKEVTDSDGFQGERTDGVNLIDEWLKSKENAVYVENRAQLLNISDDIENVLGLFNTDHVDYNVDRNPEKVPSLAEMTEAAINILGKNINGYFLFVEGARIDMAHHLTEARVALDETAEFSKAIQTAVDLTNEDDTLIVVTSDHAHAMSFSGYATRGNDIFAAAGTGSDKIPYLTLSYANGPGYRSDTEDGNRYDCTADDDFEEDHYQFPATAPLSSETHGGDDVGVFARGPWAHLFSGVIEQNVIPHLMSFASCVGEGYKAC